MSNTPEDRPWWTDELEQDERYWREEERKWLNKTNPRPRHEEANKAAEVLARLLERRKHPVEREHVLRLLKWPDSKLNFARHYASKIRRDLLVDGHAGKYLILRRNIEFASKAVHSYAGIEGHIDDMIGIYEEFVKQERAGNGNAYTRAMIQGYELMKTAIVMYREKAMENDPNEEE